jgi:hypothetical protein
MSAARAGERVSATTIDAAVTRPERASVSTELRYADFDMHQFRSSRDATVIPAYFCAFLY